MAAEVVRWGVQLASGVGTVLVASLLCSPPAVGAQAADASTGVPAGRVESGPEGLLSSFSVAAERGPVTIEAEEMEFDYRALLLTYRGSVTVTQDDLTLRSNVLSVRVDPEKVDRLKEIVAEGDVRIEQGDRRATGGRAIFDEAARTVTLSDHAVLREGQNEVSGSRVVVYLDEERSVVEGGQERVRAVLYPPEAEPLEMGEASDVDALEAEAQGEAVHE